MLKEYGDSDVVETRLYRQQSFQNFSHINSGLRRAMDKTFLAAVAVDITNYKDFEEQCNLFFQLDVVRSTH